jgi:hypothetical protein
MYYKQQQQQQIKLDCRKEKLTQPNLARQKFKTKKSNNSDDVVMITARKQNLDGIKWQTI